MQETAQTIGASTADFTFSIAGADMSELKVVRFDGTEAISRLYSFQLVLTSDNADIDIAAMVAQQCLLAISADGGTRHVHGIVRSFKRTGQSANRTHYACEVVPQHWLLTRRHGCRIFQEHNCPDMTVPGIIKKVLCDAGIPDDRYRFVLHGQYEPRDYVVQYRETEMDFISRLMEEEGLFYFFEHSDDGHVMVLGDTPAAHVDTPFAEDYPYRDPTGLVACREHIFRFAEQREIACGAVSLDDFNFNKPGMDLASCVKAEEFTSLAWEDYPGRFAEKPAGERYAQIRLEERQWKKHQIELTATARGLMAGYFFTMVEHPSEDANRRYLVTNVTHRGQQPQSGEEEAPAYQEVGYEAQIHTIPCEIPYRHPCCTPCPRMQGTQTAIVVGPKDEEIYVDEHARVKVQFHWDKEGNYDENSSCWIRVSQVWAGGEYGVNFHPRVGHEVIVDFIEGDPDRPIIVGRVHNCDLPPIYELPKSRDKCGIWTQSYKGGGGCSGLIFSDEKDEEWVSLHSQKYMEITAEQDMSEHYGRYLETVVDEDRYELIKGYHQSEVRLDDDEKVGGNKSRQIGGSFAVSVGGAHAESCGSYYLNAGKGEIVLESSSAITLKVGGSFVKVHGGGVDIMGSIVNINSGGSPGNGCGAPFGEFEEVYEAEYLESPGYDVSYNKNNPPPEDGCAPCDDSADENSDDEKKTSWIEIELVDEAGQPWPNEPYEIITTDGEKITGTLDAKGQARVALDEDGVQKISFPRLDQDAWERA
jgi:type VI secretion system secreted protein VgrG